MGASSTVSLGAGTVGIVEADNTDPRLMPEPLPSVHPESQHPTGALWARELQRASPKKEPWGQGGPPAHLHPTFCFELGRPDSLLSGRQVTQALLCRGRRRGPEELKMWPVA